MEGTMRKISMCICLVSLAGCAAKRIAPGAQTVLLVNEAPSNCQFLGEVVGSQGNWWTDDVTSTKNKMVGARNELRNQAFAMGATHVQVMESRNTRSKVSFDVTNTTVIGNAFRCP
jgi:Domain of unknown function (DUF4156)